MDPGTEAEPPADLLPLLSAEAVDLLTTVDRTLRTYGVPPGHPVVDGLREFRALPGALAASVVELEPHGLRRTARRVARFGAESVRRSEDLRRLDDRLAWSGPGRREFGRQLAAVTGYLSESDGSTAAALAATARHGADLARWLASLRRALVEFFVRYGNGAEAVTVRAAATDDPLSSAGAALAAADLAAHWY
ncbi:MAG: hypothetical protein WCA46_31485, partial [Actinocatenispora sp.]